MSDNKRLKLSTKESLYDPIEIEVDEQLYRSRKLTHDIRKKIGELNKKVSVVTGSEESIEALYRLVEFIFKIKREVLEKLEQSEVEEIYFHFNKRFVEVEKERMEIIKKTFEKAAQIKGGKEPKEKIPKNRKRPGDKA